jgi:hypothetical protein
LKQTLLLNKYLFQNNRVYFGFDHFKYIVFISENEPKFNAFKITYKMSTTNQPSRELAQRSKQRMFWKSLNRLLYNLSGRENLRMRSYCRPRSVNGSVSSSRACSQNGPGVSSSKICKHSTEQRSPKFMLRLGLGCPVSFKLVVLLESLFEDPRTDEISYSDFRSSPSASA